MSSRANTVNDGLSYRVDDFAGYTVETSVQLLGAMERRTRISYRLIETVGAGAPRIERYLESETTRSSEPFGTVQVQRRERSRVVVQAADLQPISARGETAVWNGTDWRTAEHELRFDGNRAVGLVTDTTGHVVELDRDVPPGIVLSDVRDLAFALLDADSLVGRSVEFTTFDPRTGRIDEERYDVLGEASLEIDGASFDALRVSVATGLDNEEYLVRAARPRLVLRRSSDDGSEVETVISIDVTQPRRAGNR